MTVWEVVKRTLKFLGYLAAIVVAVVEIRAAHLKAERFGDQAGAGYQSLSVAVEELQGIVGDVENWSQQTESEIDALESKVEVLAAELKELRGGIDTEAEAAIQRALDSMPEPTRVKLKRPKQRLPRNLKQAQKMAR